MTTTVNIKSYEIYTSALSCYFNGINSLVRSNSALHQQFQLLIYCIVVQFYKICSNYGIYELLENCQLFFLHTQMKYFSSNISVMDGNPTSRSVTYFNTLQLILLSSVSN
jgi:hypothetical protein